MEKSAPVDYLLLPLNWLERASGWKRRGLVFVYLLIFTVATVLGWREVHLWRLPNLREPFDEAKYGTVFVADSDNSLPLYLEAEALIAPYSDELKRVSDKDWKYDQWAALDPAIRRWAEESRPALLPWLKATGRNDAFLNQPNQITINTVLGPQQATRELAKLALIHGARLTEGGDLAVAWSYYRGVLRSSRHVCLHGSIINRWIGFQTLRRARPSIDSWVDNPATTSEMLIRAIRDVEDCSKMTPPVSETIRGEYFMLKDALSHPENWVKYGFEELSGEDNWYLHLPRVVEARNFLMREPERSQRILRLVTAGVLAQCDRPRWARPKFFEQKYGIYEIDAKTPREVAAISPQALARWSDHSTFSKIGYSLNEVMTRLDSEPAIFDSMRLRMAERAFTIDHARPAKTYGELLGPYLKELPEGIEPGDSIGVANVAQ